MITAEQKEGIAVKFTKWIGLVLAACLLGGCGGSKTPETQIANPWRDYDSLQQAEEAVGFALGLPDETAGGWSAGQFRTMNDRLLEVIYHKGDSKLTLRKAAGSEDISGDYTQYETVTLADYANGSATIREDKGILVFTENYTWSVYCADGMSEREIQSWIEAILKA